METTSVRSSSGWEAFDELPDGVLVLQGDRVEWANLAAAHVLMRDRESVVGASTSSVLGDDESERLRSAVRLHAGGVSPPRLHRMYVPLANERDLVADARIRIVREDLVILVFHVSEQLVRVEDFLREVAHLFEQAPDAELLDGLLDRLEEVLWEWGRQWRLVVIDCLEDGFRIRDTLWRGEPDALGRYVRGLMGRKLAHDRLPLAAEIRTSGQALLLDSLRDRLWDGGGEASALARAAHRAGVTRGAWLPVCVATRVEHVLVVFGNDLNDYDVAALEMFAVQLGSRLHVRRLQRQRLQDARFAAVGEMSAVLAHEINNPLSVLGTAVPRLRKLLPNASSDVGQLLAAVEQTTADLRRLADNLLVITRPAEEEAERTELPGVVERAVRAAKYDPTAFEIPPRLTIHLPPSLPPVRVAAAKLERAVVNLVLNALQHVTPGGPVDIRGEETDRDWVRLRVFNEGQPIPPEMREHIFEPFVSYRPGGSGLGLAVVRRVVDDAGGRVEVDDTDDGASFSLWLPVAR